MHEEQLPRSATSGDAGKSFFIAFLVGGIACVLAVLNWLMPSRAPQDLKPEPGQLKARYLSIAGALFAQVGESGQMAACRYYPKQKQLSCPLPANAVQALENAMKADSWSFNDKDASRASRPGVALAEGLAVGQDNVWLRCNNDEKPCEFWLSYSI